MSDFQIIPEPKECSTIELAKKEKENCIRTLTTAVSPALLRCPSAAFNVAIGRFAFGHLLTRCVDVVNDKDAVEWEWRNSIDEMHLALINVGDRNM